MKTANSLLICSLVVVIGCSQPTAPTVNSVSDGDTQTQVDREIQVTDSVSYILEDGKQRHEKNPESFWIPPVHERENLENNQIVKLMFRITADGDIQTERMWVIVQDRTNDGYIGLLDNDPYCTDEMKSGIEVRFQPRHVIQIDKIDLLLGMSNVEESTVLAGIAPGIRGNR